MASPIGHSLLGATVATAAARGETGRPRRKIALVAVAAALAPDLDFLPGLLLGDPNRFHQLAPHSLLAGAALALISYVVARTLSERPWEYGMACGLGYASHLLLDYFTVDGRAPFGLPLLWPVDGEHYIAPWTLFRGVKHGDPGHALDQVLDQLFSMHNMATVGLEVAVLGPLGLLVWWLGWRKS